MTVAVVFAISLKLLEFCMLFADVLLVVEIRAEGDTRKGMWKDAYLESRVMAADPLELVTILYEYGIRALEDARRHLASGNIELRVKAITKAISIISELHGSLDHSIGGDLSLRLEKLYAYMTMRLTVANVKRKEEPIEEVEKLMRTLAEAWNTIRNPGEPVGATHMEAFAYAASNLPFAAQESVRGTLGGWNG
jgi:flagellar protein FliS